ncbi:MAG: hypothetical protein AAB425_13925 [Bdellovibrionota bacterium]
MKSVRITSILFQLAVYSVLILGSANQADADISELTGSWASACHPHYSVDDPETISAYNVRRVSVTETGDYTFAIDIYDENDIKCVGKRAAVFWFNGVWRVSYSSRNGAREIEGTVEKYFINIGWKSWVTGANVLGLCGLRSWRSGKTLNVTDRNCKGFGELTGNRPVFQIYDFDVRKKELIFGELTSEKDATTEKNRPTQVDTIVLKPVE